MNVIYSVDKLDPEARRVLQKEAIKRGVSLFELLTEALLEKAVRISSSTSQSKQNTKPEPEPVEA